MKSRVTLLSCFLLLALVMAGCGGTAEPTPIPRQQIEGSFNVNGLEMFLRCEGEGSPTVIMDHDFDNTSAAWLVVFKAVSEQTYTCFYDRVGKARSDIPSDYPRNSMKAVEALHTLLESAGVQGPFIMAANWDAGLNALVYQDRYPIDTVGLVLVDAIHPGVKAKEESIGVVVPFPDIWDRRSSNDPERTLDFRASTTEAGKIDSLGDLPLAVVSRGRTARWSGIGSVKLEVYQEMWLELQGDLAALSTNSKLITADECSQDDILLECADQVTDAITDMVADLRGE